MHQLGWTDRTSLPRKHLATSGSRGSKATTIIRDADWMASATAADQEALLTRPGVGGGIGAAPQQLAGIPAQGHGDGGLLPGNQLDRGHRQ